MQSTTQLDAEGLELIEKGKILFQTESTKLEGYTSYKQGLNIIIQQMKQTNNADIKKSAEEFLKQSFSEIEDMKSSIPKTDKPQNSFTNNDSLEPIEESTKKYEGAIIGEKLKSNWDEEVFIHPDLKNFFQEMVIPLKYPKIFREHPKKYPKTFLAYGPEGVGKNYAIRSLSNLQDAGLTLYEIKPSINSEDDADYIKFVFLKAQETKPSLILIDKVEQILNSNSVKVQDSIRKGLESMSDDNYEVLAVGISEKPWDIQSGDRREFFSIHREIGLPDDNSRRRYINKHLQLENNQSENIINATNGFSFTDLKQLIFKNNITRELNDILNLLKNFKPSINQDELDKFINFKDQLEIQDIQED